jgi:hypothetical protein
MGVTRAQVEAAAPDQAALKAAGGLLKSAIWPLRAIDAAGTLIWGECQGSGANPYRVMADISDLGTKCTCPSRKFPCKHALALLWMLADDPRPFQAAPVPEWVDDWLSRRRKGSAPTAKLSAGASIDDALTATEAAPPDPKAEARRAAAAEKRSIEVRATIRDATRELDNWIEDQLRTGISSFLGDHQGRCRRIAARLVDGKAAGLASRIDEMPSRLMALRAAEQPEGAIVELAKLSLLVRAWRSRPGEPELAREVTTAEARDALLQSADATRVKGIWEALGDRITTRRDGLVSHATWLFRRSAGATDTHRFAVLLDYYPASAGRRSTALGAGDQFEGEVIFYPAVLPLRAILGERQAVASAALLPPEIAPAADILAGWRDRLSAAPWAQEQPVFLPSGRFATDESGHPWWRADSGEHALPLAEAPDEHLYGFGFAALAGVWNGWRFDPIAGWSDWGRVNFNG